MRENRYIVIEGPIGVGKTTLTRMLASRWNAQLVLEEADQNPFLREFYRGGRQNAFQTQLYFLLSRHRQQHQLFQQDLFQRATVCDYLFHKDRFFAEINLSEQELGLYDQVFRMLRRDILTPDLVVYLYAPIDLLMERVWRRRREYENQLHPDYLARVVEKYSQYFFNYRESPLLMVNTEQIDFVNTPEHFVGLLSKIEQTKTGTNYFNPAEGR